MLSNDHMVGLVSRDRRRQVGNGDWSMSESIASRVQRLVSGSINGMVDALENAAPDMLMREAIRDLDQAADDVRNELAQTVAMQNQASRRLSMTMSKREELTGKASLAVGQGRQALAAAALVHQIDFETQVPVLEGTIRDTAAKQADLERYLTALGARKREMEAQLASFLAARRARDIGAATGSANTVGTAKRRIDWAQGAFGRAFSGATNVPGVAESDREMLAKLTELEKNLLRDSIAQRLAAINAMTTASLAAAQRRT